MEKTEKKTQKVSVSYTLKALNANIGKLLEAGLLSKEEAKTMDDLKEKALQNWIKKEFK